jgi:uncharacterized membrane protein
MLIFWNIVDLVHIFVMYNNSLVTKDRQPSQQSGIPYADGNFTLVGKWMASQL